MIDLSFEWGMTPAQVAQSLTERDLVMVGQYARKWMLPTRRLQMQLARLCQITAADPNARLGSFLFDPEPLPEAVEPGAEAVEMVAENLGTGVYMLGQKRKHKE